MHCLIGTMSGGGKTVSKGLMGSTIMDNVDPEELAKVENMLKEVTICSICFLLPLILDKFSAIKNGNNCLK